MKIRRIILDMDEVLTDFIGSALRKWGVDPVEHLEAWRGINPGDWNMLPALERCLRRPSLEMTQKLFWSLINEDEAFWGDMPETPWCDQVIDLVSSKTDDWHIVSSPSQCLTCQAGKYRWIARKFGTHFDRFVPYHHKHVFAGPGVVIIDDREETVERFKDHGGQGVVFPHIANSRHALAGDPVSYVRSALEYLEAL